VRLPFTHTQFLDLFGAYNAALWPGAALLWVVTLAALWALAAGRLGPRLAGALLALHWAWSGLAYHLVFFTRINEAARVLGALFLIQAALFLYYGAVRGYLVVTWGRAPRQVASMVLCVYALVYPLLALAAGLTWPRMPSFGVPCPSTLLTAGLLLALAPGRLRGLSIVPILWALVGGTAALTLAIRPDLMLFVAALSLALYALAPAALAGRRPA
jgi:hypothetical protein